MTLTGMTLVNRSLALCLTLIFAAVILWGTLRPSEDGVSSLPLNDKQIHALAFAGLVLPMSFVPNTSLWRLALGAAFFGAAIELIQPTFGRSAEWADLAADIVGIALGLLPAVFFDRWGRSI